jgi:hypothetical protein
VAVVISLKLVYTPVDDTVTAPLSSTSTITSTPAVTRTSDRGHLTEAETNVIEVSGFSIRVSKETLLTLNVHFCVQFPAQRC